VTGFVGAVIAGGRSVRYGAPKALAEVGGHRIIDRVVRALAATVDEVVVIANDAELAGAVALPSRADAIGGLGALGGIHAALRWARELERAGILAVACDMPFLSVPLLERLVRLAQVPDGPAVVAPASRGPRGIEPLCACYRVSCLDAIERAIARGDHRVVGFHDEVRVVTLPLPEVVAFGDPDVLFMNVNTPADRDAAERLAAGAAG